MNTRYKLATALSLALATGFAGVAAARTTEPSNPTTTPAVTQPAAAASMPAKAPMTKLPTRTVAQRGYRTHVGHRTTKHAKVARISSHAKLTHKAGLKAHTKIAKASLVRKHITNAKGLYARHAMNRAVKTTVIR